MLVLTRKAGESLMIGSDIKISIVEIKGKTVKIGVEAPPECIIHREEIYKRIQEENDITIHSNMDVERVSRLWEKLHGDDDDKKQS